MSVALLRRRVSPVPPLLLAMTLAGVGSMGAAMAATQPPPPQQPSAAAAPLRGLTLEQALRRLQAEGLTVVFTDAVVRPEMRVVREPEARRPRAILDEVLAPHGLEVREGPPGVLVVVESPVGAGTRLFGAVLAAGGAALERATVSLPAAGRDAVTGSDGRFAIEDMAAGTYLVAAGAAGYLEQRVTVGLDPGGAREVIFRLQPQPFLEEEIVVRPSRLTLLAERAESSFSFGRDQIEAQPHLGDDVFRSTSLLPGTTANDVTAQFSVHGGRRDEVKILLDGQELYEAFHLKDYDNALSVVPASTLEQATLSTGGFAASQGDRMGGVLDLRTAEASSGRRFEFGASVLQLRAEGSGRMGERGSWLASARRGSIDLARRFLGDEDPGFWDLLGKLDLDLGGGRLGFRGLAAGDELELTAFEDEESFETFENDYRSRYYWLPHQAPLSARVAVETSGSWSSVRRSRGGNGGDEEGSYALGDRRDLEVLGLQQAWSFDPGPRQLARWGWELRHYDAEFEYLKILDPEFLVLAPFSPPRATEVEFVGTIRSTHFGGWASDRLALGERAYLEAGLRFDRHSATSDQLWSPRLNLAWRRGERSVLRASWGRFHQSQRPYELQVEDGDAALFPAEESEHAVLGWESLLPDNRVGVEAVRVELFHREVADPRPSYENLLEPLNFFPEIEPDRVRISAQRAEASGLELLVRGRRGWSFDWWLAYSYARSRDRIDRVEVPRALDQPHTVTAGLDRRFGSRWSLSLAWRYHSGWPTTPISAQEVVDPGDPEEEPEQALVFGPLRSRRVGPYHRLDLRASRVFDLARGRLTVFVDVQNLYDRANLAGFDVQLDDEEGVAVLDPEHWPGIFPSAGVSWAF